MAETLNSSPNSPPPNPNLDPQPSNSSTEQHLKSLSLSDDVIIADVDLGEKIENLDSNNAEKQQRRISSGGSSSSCKFPIRDGVIDCSFYLRTGLCKFGINCKFNHPPSKISQGGKAKGKEETVDVGELKVKENDGSLDKEGQTDCKYFDRPGGCKFGKACKNNHIRKISPPLELNFVGLPIRPGEKECPYYMRTGSCKYGARCRFNHPNPTPVGGPDALPVYDNGSSNLSSNASKSTMPPWSPAASLNESTPYVPFMFPPNQGVPSRPEWTSYQAPAYPTETNMNMAPAYVMNGQLLDVNVFASQQEQILADEFPERPGQPECSYFLKTGNCKYRSACRFHHPKITTPKSPPPCTLSDLGLPIRPGESVCSYYSRYGICKYGPACKYDHPIHCAGSAPMPMSATDETP